VAKLQSSETGFAMNRPAKYFQTKKIFTLKKKAKQKKKKYF